MERSAASRAAKLRPLSIATIMLLGVLATPSYAATIEVSDVVDAIPAPPGSLRWAIEVSESNGESDTISFLIDGGTIDLVAPLPDLIEGGLSINKRPDTSAPPGGSGIFINGGGVVNRAIAIRSGDNTIASLDFINFVGNETILLSGHGANENVIAGNVFRTGELGASGAASIRIVPAPFGSGTPGDNTIAANRFATAFTGIVIEGDGSASPSITSPWKGTWVLGNSFGGTATGVPGDPPDLQIGVRVIDALVEIRGNTFSNLERAIDLGPGANNANVFRNVIGGDQNGDGVCDGFEDGGIRVDSSSGVEIRHNAIDCADQGIALLDGADDAVISDNLIGDAENLNGNRSHGILIDQARGATIRQNTIVNNTGFGISATVSPLIDPLRNVMSCNSIFRNGSGAMSLPGGQISPPTLTGATVTSVEGQNPDPVIGWVEVFGDATDQGRLFQGATTLRNDPGDVTFTHLLPVLDLQLEQGPAGTEFKFSTAVPENHTSTATDRGNRETSEYSAALSAADTGIVYDIIRGRLNALSVGVGGISLGEVTCIDNGVDPVGVPVALDAIDPQPGGGFFYVVRKRSSLANTRGTYDPAICLTELDEFAGNRKPTAGDCN